MTNVTGHAERTTPLDGPGDRSRQPSAFWFSSVPSHWNATPLKYVASFRGGGTPSKDNAEFWQGTIPWVSPKDMRSSTIVDTEDHISELALQGNATSLVGAGALLVVVRSGILRRAIPTAINLVSVALNQDMKAIILGPTMSPGYLRYTIEGHQELLLVEWRKTGATVESIEHDLLVNTVFPLPPLDEQRAIAAFLDRKTAQIDELIAKKERLIALLQEKRAAAITHAVTKGLDPDAPLKDSGIEWLGEVPAHWRVLRTKFVARLASGHTPSRQHPEYWEDCTIPWFGLADVWQLRNGRREYVEETKERISELGLRNSAAELLPSGTVILSRTASVGFSGIMGTDMATTQDFANWVCGRAISPDYLLYVFRSMSQEFKRLNMGSTHQTIYMPAISAFSCPLPSLKEQAGIVAEIRRSNAKIDVLTDSVVRVIDQLREYRSSLVAAAVTGQIDVRGSFE